MDAAARPDVGQQPDGAGTRSRWMAPVSYTGLEERQFTDVRLDAGQAEAEAIRNAVPRDRAALIYSLVAATLVAAILASAPSFADFPGVVALRDPEFWFIAVLAVAVDAWPF